MLHLESLTYLPNRHAIDAGTTLDCEKGLILFRRQFCPSGDQFLTEAKKLPHRMSEGTERSVVLCLERFLHPRGFWRSFPRRTNPWARNAIFLRSVRGPEACPSHVRQYVVITCRDLWKLIYRL